MAEDGQTQQDALAEPEQGFRARLKRAKDGFREGARVYRRMVGYLARHKLAIFLVVLSSGLVAALEVGGIASLAPVVDLFFKKDAVVLNKYPFMESEYGQRVVQFVTDVVLADRVKALMCFAAAVATITFLRSVFAIIKEYLGAMVGFKITLDLRQDLFDRIIHAPLPFFSKEGVARTVARIIVDAGSVNQGLTVLFQDAIVEQLKFIGFVALAFCLNWRWALLAFVALPAIAYALARSMQRIRRYTRRSLDKTATLQTLLHEFLYGIRVVKAFLMEDYSKERHRSEQLKLLRYFRKGTFARTAIGPTTEAFGVAGLCLFIALVGAQVLRANVDPGRFVAFFGAVFMVYQPLRKTTKVAGAIQVSLVAGQRVFEFMDTQIEVLEAPDAERIGPLQRSLNIENVCFGYDGERNVLDNVSLEVSNGEVVAIVGLSGAGKSTMASLVPRFYDPGSGKIELDGVDLRTVTLKSLREQIAVVTQHPILFHDTIKENIMFGTHDASDEQILWAAKIANAHDFITRLPEGYNTVLGEGGMTLSGGERQRIAIARAILSDPVILILDEPTSSLDAESEEIVADALIHAMEGRTTIVVSHRFSLVRRASKILVLDQGRVEACGSHEELLEKSPTYIKLFTSGDLA